MVMDAVQVPLDADLLAISALTGTGFLAHTGSATWAERTITGTAAEITVTNGNGVSANPTLSLPAALTFTGKTVTGGTFAGLTAVTTTALTVSGLTDGRIPQAGTAGLIADSLLGTSGITGLLTLTKDGTTARTATFPDAAIVVSGSASALTSGRVPYATTGGLLTDSAALTFSGTALTLSSAATGGISIAATSGTTLTVSSTDAAAITCSGGASLTGALGVTATARIGTASLDADVSNAFGTATLAAVSAASSVDTAIIGGYGASAVGAHLYGFKTRSTSATCDANTAVQSGDELFAFAAYGSSPNGDYRGAALFKAVVDGAPSGTIIPGKWEFYTRDGVGNLVVRATLTSTAWNLASGLAYQVAGTQVVGAQGAAVADATDAATAISQLNALLARCRSHGLIAT